MYIYECTHEVEEGKEMRDELTCELGIEGVEAALLPVSVAGQVHQK